MLRDKKYLFYPYQIYKYIIFYPILGLSTAFFGTMAILLTLTLSPRVGTISGVIWAKLNSYFTPMFVKVRGKENMDPRQSYVVVANHQSQYDIFVIYGWFPVDFKWVMKMQLRAVPFLGYSCYKLGHVFVDRSNPEAAIRTINEAKSRVKNGTSIMFFPEGTRSPDGRLIPFKKGAFMFAIDMNLPILPVSIVGSKNVLPNNTTDLFPGRAEMIIHEPISVEGYDYENIQGLMDRARDSIQKVLSE